MKVKANINYKDILLNRQVNKGEVIEVSEERAKLLTTKEFNGIKFCVLVEGTPDVTTEEEVEPTKAKSKKRNGKH